MFSQEIKVGFIVLLGLIIFASGAAILGDVRFQKGYEINILFDDIAGLPEKAPVKVCGVDIGKVKEINLVRGKAEVRAWIKKSTKIRSNSKVSIISTGVIGTKYLEMSLGTEDYPYLKEGDVINGISPVSFEEVMGKLIAGLDDILDVIGSFGGNKDLGTALTEISGNLRDITSKLNSALGRDEAEARGVFEDFKQFIGNLKKASKNIDDMLEKNKAELGNMINTLNKLGPNLEEASVTLANLARSIEKGEGPLAKLINDKEMTQGLEEIIVNLKEASNKTKTVLDRFGGAKTTWEYSSRYAIEKGIMRSDLGVNILPSGKKYYYLGIDNIGRSGGSYDSGSQEINSLTATIGRFVGPFTFYAGSIRSTGGLGLTYSPFLNRKFMLEGNAFDFTRKIDGEERVHVNVGGKLKLTRWVFLRLYSEDIFEKKEFSTSLNLIFSD